MPHLLCEHLHEARLLVFHVKVVDLSFEYYEVMVKCNETKLLYTMIDHGEEKLGVAAKVKLYLRFLAPLVVSLTASIEEDFGYAVAVLAAE